MFLQWPFDKTVPVGSRGMVAAKHPLAAEAGVQVLRRGGSAVDAAIATSFVSGVVEPYMSGIGGGGLALHWLAGQQPVALHCGMRAPASATPDMYEIVPGTYQTNIFGWPETRGNAHASGPKSIAAPGLLPGLHRLWQLGGRLAWSELVRPAIRLAQDGFLVDWLTSLRTLEG
jgi:gamma-glutamyltranspeptidase/glutathione hydrolase